VKLRVGVLISGRGSNLQALIEACAKPDYPAEIALVISNDPEAIGLVRAQGADLTAETIEHHLFEDRRTFEDALTISLEKAGVDLVCLAGFMRLLTASFVSHWENRVINIHPSLLPAFKGLDVHERVIASGVRFSGCTVHFVRADMDAGPIIVQSAVPVHPADEPKDLAARVLTSEHECLPLAIRMIAEGRVRVENDVVRVVGATSPVNGLINPSGFS
tara:strand:- start:1930 stop:2583 length:654 start_codon:yes stop_codon:yes gene_type:complete